MLCIWVQKMVTDLILDDFLQRINDTPTSPIELKVTQSSLQDTTDWQMHFNRMSVCEMYVFKKL